MIPRLLEAARDKDPRVRLDAVRALGELGPAAIDVVSDLLTLMEKDEDLGVRLEIASTLSKIDPHEKAIVRAIRARIGSTNVLR